MAKLSRSLILLRWLVVVARLGHEDPHKQRRVTQRRRQLPRRRAFHRLERTHQARMLALEATAFEREALAFAAQFAA